MWSSANQGPSSEFADKVIHHSPPFPSQPVHALLPVLNHNWTDQPIDHWCIASWTSYYCMTSSLCPRIWYPPTTGIIYITWHMIMWTKQYRMGMILCLQCNTSDFSWEAQFEKVYWSSSQIFWGVIIHIYHNIDTVKWLWNIDINQMVTRLYDSLLNVIHYQCPYQYSINNPFLTILHYIHNC